MLEILTGETSTLSVIQEKEGKKGKESSAQSNEGEKVNWKTQKQCFFSWIMNQLLRIIHWPWCEQSHVESISVRCHYSTRNVYLVYYEGLVSWVRTCFVTQQSQNVFPVSNSDTLRSSLKIHNRNWQNNTYSFCCNRKVNSELEPNFAAQNQAPLFEKHSQLFLSSTAISVTIHLREHELLLALWEIKYNLRVETFWQVELCR